MRPATLAEMAAGYGMEVPEIPLLFGPGLLEEYQLCRTGLGLDDARLAHIARCSIEASGAPAGFKSAAASGVERWLAGTS